MVRLPKVLLTLNPVAWGYGLDRWTKSQRQTRQQRY